MFKTIRWKNLLSTGNVFTEIKLNKSPNTLVVGENGAGKSTLLDAICFVLYGKPFRKIKKDQLVNSINERDCVVEIEFAAYNKEYRIVRGIKPNIFEIYVDGVMMNQNAAVKDYQDILERNILRMNMKSFTQVVILGSSSFVPFMRLPTQDRREILEDLLDIRIFSTMATLLRDRNLKTRELIKLNEKDIENTKQLLQAYMDAARFKREDIEKAAEECAAQIEKLEEEISEHEREIDTIDAEIQFHKINLLDSKKLEKQTHELERLSTNLTNKVKKTKDQVEHLMKNDFCETCKQPMSEEIREKHAKEKSKASEEYGKALTELTERYTKLQEQYAENEKKRRIIDDLEAKRRSITTNMNYAQRDIVSNTNRINDMMKQIAESKNDKLDETKEKQAGFEKDREQLLKQRSLYDVADVILRDSGIKARIVKQYIPIINTLVNKYLAAMDFFVKFELNEAFEEKILSRHRDDFSYASFSQGEKMRIDLALLFTWRTVARMKNSASTNLLILDEVFDASLDASGCEEFLEMIHNLENANVFVISHKGDVLQDKFRSSIKFEKHANFSRIAGP